ncbi:conserved hypothetical protein [Methylocella tundrae]|uniref:DUF3572 domain-containing protein n=1 Tax=Methylocella tundrae TaxID=227605 RepID=A0A8B6M7Q1_METTU|nr:DUF3572 domain-containing protein [Methylocella tundrae]VTZ26867.1 conserved hypothetical protein [Methylocella tundrae]VTZ50837.1 conserved hypothetical protein [Methylocella tundrae]
MQNGGNRSNPGKAAGPREAAKESAEALAIEVLGYIAADPAALEGFMSLSGLEIGNLRAAAAEPGFFVGVLDFLASNEALLLAFAANAGRDPAAILRARHVLAPPEEMI